ncbi:MAG: YtxH domain-containing protein, partial [Gemmatimonadaceae bacterium]|nr:YtxH domain-containing protein [Gemmatimonadaceae bacterium]
MRDDDYEFDDDEPYVVIERQSAGIGSFLVGAAIGAGLALLFAPKS